MNHLAGVSVAALCLGMAGAALAEGEFAGITIEAKLIGGQQYEALYARIPEWEKATGATVKIISQKSHEINEANTPKMDRGSTQLHTETGYLHSRQNMILTVISNRELSKLNQLVMEIDPTAFMIIGKVNEVHGNGFTLPKKHAVKTEK